jgi:tyrosinase
VRHSLLPLPIFLPSNNLFTGDKCIQDATDNVAITGTVPLTNGLLEIWKAESNTTLRSLRKQDVLPWLTTNLHWRVTSVDGREVDRGSVEGLKISVVTTEITVNANEFPVYSGVYAVHCEVTEGRPGGFCEHDNH